MFVRLVQELGWVRICRMHAASNLLAAPINPSSKACIAELADSAGLELRSDVRC